MKHAFRILLVRLSHLGDVVNALPVFHALREEHPSAQIGWVVQPEFSDLLRGLKALDRVFLFDRRGGGGAWLKLKEDLLTFGAHWTIDVQGNIKSAVACLCSGAPRRSGLHRSNWTEPFGANVLTEHAPPLAGGLRTHALERSLHLARFLAPKRGDVPRGPALVANDAEIGQGRATYEAFFGEAEKPIIVPLCASEDVRSWSEERYGELARALARRGRGALFVSGPGEVELGRRLAAQHPDGPLLRHWIGQRGQRELVGFFAAARERGARVLGCDSGPSHLAAACGLPVTLLAGPQDPRRTGPWPLPEGGERSKHRIVRADPCPPCVPCISRHCTHPEGPVCMSRIDAERAAEALVETGS